ncbi:hypothetical protein PMZ80_011240 [Knufia obscura]|uniref:Uncharacterized protein n=3 Tax=Trichomeriaceae TaxID=1233474 RepID=A0AAN7T1W7_9EURO|nr:hypothetical protein LTR24_009683 [Lithohypha guttulata]KAK5310046.1 hypothetical protein LTR70_009780 [Exophiala xenobiotica]KAK5936530.1 hypothetical protein PMZ80_011240 [Knufia obscura]KAK5078785.1 hypothetical protein LTR51_000976 [Lithohypha guttulata]KAK5085989.1 hypothetical protein LTR05_005279 [Lithohypha guttulata]
MRLLKRQPLAGVSTSNQFSLTEFRPSNIPPVYAILSRRWGPDEVTLKDVESGTAETKADYRKLEFCAEQAAHDGIVYFWIDTCCIDKANNTELSEAINSMFKWYQNATKCYVYLADVPIYNSAGGTPTKDQWEAAFQKSEWFDRGWTLQELIAPQAVEFFSVEGKKLGDKMSLEGPIHQVTGIPIDALRGKPLAQFDEQERLSWTARRETTIEEDAVYCLLGIFDTHMPLIYGEGRQKALARLQREIRISADPALLVASDTPWVVPFERNPRFTGRETQLGDLQGKLFAKGHTSKIAITGLGGVGKTQLVLELLYRTKTKHKGCSVLWIPATNTESLHQGYLIVARQLEIAGHEDDKADVKKLVQDYLSKEDTGQWLLVFDNADDIHMWMTPLPTPARQDVEGSVQISSGQPSRLIDYLPKSKRGCIIFTTRDRKAAAKLAQQNIITVPEMSETAARELLKKCLATPDLVDHLPDATALLAALTHLPLAIAQAAAYINANGITLADYLSLLDEKEEETIEVLSEEFEDGGRYHEVKNPVATTWLISFEQIRQHDPLAAEYLSFIACINSRNIPQSLLPSESSRKRELEAIGTLTAYSFVSRRPVESALDVHRLVHLATRNWLRKEGMLSQWMEKTITRLEEVFPDDDHDNRSIWRIYLPHVRQVLESDLISNSGEKRMALVWRYGQCLYSDGRWSEAEASFNEILATEMKTLDEESPSVLSSMAWLASTYSNQGRWEEAEQLQVQVVETFRTNLGAEHPSTLTSMANLAFTWKGLGRDVEAVQLMKDCVQRQTRILGAKHPDSLSSHLAIDEWELEHSRR